MYNKIISKILNKDFLKQDKSFFEHGMFDFTTEKVFLDKKYFRRVSEGFNGKICFVDGGSSEIVSSSDFGLFFIRIVGVVYKNNKKQKIIKKQFFALVSMIEKQKKTYYQFEAYGDDGFVDEFLIDIFDKTMMFGGKRVLINRVGDLIRTLSEIHISTEITKNLDKGDIIVLDGNLEPDKTYKRKYLNDLYKKASDKKINVCAISKTCNIITNKTRSIIAAIQDLKPELDTYYYYPTNKSEQEFDIAFVKLNPSSDYVFRLDFLKTSNLDIIVQGLADNSTDFAFPGYPYGLVMADKFARISNNEKQYHITTLMTKQETNGVL